MFCVCLFEFSVIAHFDLLCLTTEVHTAHIGIRFCVVFENGTGLK